MSLKTERHRIWRLWLFRSGFAIFVALVALFTQSCLSWFQLSAVYDPRTITIQTLSLFNQRTVSQFARESWRGDWIFRRERLALIDQELRSSKPDMIVLQEMVARQGSPSESDQAILSAGALSGYLWNSEEVQEFDDTQEVQTMAVAVGLPLRPIELEESARGSWSIGNEGFLQVSVVDFEAQPIVVFNVQMPPRFGRNFLWYTFIEERISEFLKQGRYCPKRVVVAGFMPTDQGSQRFAGFVENLQLKDTGAGFCQVASRCYTSTPTNEMFRATSGEEVAAQTDRVLVHNSAIVYTSARNFESVVDASEYSKRFGVSQLTATQRFGWLSTVRLARCGDNEFL